MKNAATLLLLALPLHAQTPEAVRAAGAGAFRAAPALFAAPEPGASEPVLQAPPAVLPFRPAGARFVEVARVNLAAQLDKQRALLARQLGEAARDIGVASDARLSSYYLTFTPVGQAGPVTLAALGDLNRLRGTGVDLRVDASTVYNFKVSANIFNPTRGSTLNIKPVQGTRGPGHDVKTGVVLDAVKARATVFRAGGKEFWLHFGTDVNAAGTGLGDTRSFLIIHENGLSSKAWPLAETALPLGAAGSVDLGGTRLVMTRSAGQLVITEATR